MSAFETEVNELFAPSSSGELVLIRTPDPRLKGKHVTSGIPPQHYAPRDAARALLVLPIRAGYRDLLGPITNADGNASVGHWLQDVKMSVL